SRPTSAAASATRPCVPPSRRRRRRCAPRRATPPKSSGRPPAPSTRRPPPECSTSGRQPGTSPGSRAPRTLPRANAHAAASALAERAIAEIPRVLVPEPAELALDDLLGDPLVRERVGELLRGRVERGGVLAEDLDHRLRGGRRDRDAVALPPRGGPRREILTT